MAKRKNYSPDFKAKVALAALSNEKTAPELSMEHGVHQNLINKRKAQLKESAAWIFSGSIKKNCYKGTEANQLRLWRFFHFHSRPHFPRFESL